MELKLTKTETNEMVDALTNFYNGLDSIEKYFLERKKEKIIGLDTSKYIDKLFNDNTIEPKDMKFELDIMGPEFTNIVQMITSLPLESQIGRQINIGVRETTTNKYVGFIRLASPILTIKPRNEYFGFTLDAKSVNKNMINGAVIVPVQPFGYNILGGKLLALISTSHEVRNMLKDKYGEKMEPCFFETTSLYGDLKGSSMYDGLKPFIRYQSLTSSDLFLFPTEKVYSPIRTKIRELYGNKEWNNNIIDPKPSGPKMREFNKVISIIKLHLKHYDEEKYKTFSIFTKEKMKSKTKKRYYYSNYGFNNVKENIENDIKLTEGENFNKHNMEYMIEWWKKKSQYRYDKLKTENKLRTELEIYTENTINNNIDMVR